MRFRQHRILKLKELGDSTAIFPVQLLQNFCEPAGWITRRLPWKNALTVAGRGAADAVWP